MAGKIVHKITCNVLSGTLKPAVAYYIIPGMHMFQMYSANSLRIDYFVSICGYRNWIGVVFAIEQSVQV